MDKKQRHCEDEIEDNANGKQNTDEEKDQGRKLKITVGDVEKFFKTFGAVTKFFETTTKESSSTTNVKKQVKEIFCTNKKINTYEERLRGNLQKVIDTEVSPGSCKMQANGNLSSKNIANVAKNDAKRVGVNGNASSLSEESKVLICENGKSDVTEKSLNTGIIRCSSRNLRDEHLYENVQVTTSLKENEFYSKNHRRKFRYGNIQTKNESSTVQQQFKGTFQRSLSLDVDRKTSSSVGDIEYNGVTPTSEEETPLKHNIRRLSLPNFHSGSLVIVNKGDEITEFADLQPDSEPIKAPFDSFQTITRPNLLSGGLVVSEELSKSIYIPNYHVDPIVCNELPECIELPPVSPMSLPQEEPPVFARSHSWGELVDETSKQVAMPELFPSGKPEIRPYVRRLHSQSSISTGSLEVSENEQHVIFTDLLSQSIQCEIEPEKVQTTTKETPDSLYNRRRIPNSASEPELSVLVERSRRHSVDANKICTPKTYLK